MDKTNEERERSVPKETYQTSLGDLIIADVPGSRRFIKDTLDGCLEVRIFVKDTLVGCLEVRRFVKDTFDGCLEVCRFVKDTLDGFLEVHRF